MLGYQLALSSEQEKAVETRLAEIEGLLFHGNRVRKRSLDGQTASLLKCMPTA